MTEIIPNENVIAKKKKEEKTKTKLRQEGAEENLGKIHFQFFKECLKTSIEKEKKVLVQPKLNITLKKGLVFSEKIISGWCNGEVLLSFMFKCFLNLPGRFSLAHPAAVNSADDILFPKALCYTCQLFLRGNELHIHHILALCPQL